MSHEDVPHDFPGLIEQCQVTTRAHVPQIASNALQTVLAPQVILPDGTEPPPEEFN